MLQALFISLNNRVLTLPTTDPFCSTVDEMMVDLLNGNDKEVIFTACGVLINLMADDDRRPMLRKNGGVTM